MKYKITYLKDGKIKHSIIKANSKEDISLSYDIISIKEYSKFKLPTIKTNNHDILFKELGVILNSSLSFSDGINLLLKNTQNSYHKEILSDINQALNSGKQVDIALEKHKKTIGILPILFFKIGFLSGDIKQAIQNLNLILEISNKSKKMVLTAITYPIIVTIFLFLALLIIFNIVVPQFEILYIQFNSNLPFATKLLLSTKDTFVNYGFIFLLLLLVFTLIINFKIKTSFDFKLKMDKILFNKIPLVSKIISLWNIHRFFLILSSLLDSKYSFVQSLQNAQLISTNSFVLSKLQMIEKDIQSGSMIHKAFEKSELFDELCYKLIYSGEISNTIPQITKELENIYKSKLEERIKSFSSLIEPVFLLFIAVIIMWLVLALMLPIWEMGNIIR
ncbi:type II secretion system F family protein [Arcobacter sp. FWKO B]|uniref:type II secretion system F family protein n=1 Tax=Arcobacter sp. FWKO B TaxID=2593672 RepID=UPI0018A4DE99|nr:type II secretion system F family protein [Arcobacter sp. FWKO B]QOG12573.1 type II secretion system F family protein [Arcobacter sp. FWKO B]